jgi:hypothetical protein
MTHQPTPRRRSAGLVAVTAASLAAAGLAGLGGTSYANAGSDPGAVHAPRGTQGEATRDPVVDVTTQGARTQLRSLRTVAAAMDHRATRALATPTDPGQTVLDLSGTTGTVRWLGRLDGFLTGRSDRSPEAIALGYVEDNAQALGLVQADVATFHLQRNYRDITGTHHLYFTQRLHHATVQGNGLTASVDRAGRLLTLGGAPVSTVSAAATLLSGPRTITTPGQALARTRGTATPGADLSQDSAAPLLFVTADGLRPAWQTIVMSTAHPASTVVDARTGRTLLRQPLTAYDHSTGRVFRFFPGAHHGGRQVKVDFTRHHWLGRHARTLNGNNSHTYSDVNDDDIAGGGEEVRAAHGQSWGYRLHAFDLPWAKSFCDNPWPCSWNPNRAYSWRTNRAQNATQVFYYVNNWHDHLAKAPIGFTEAAGNFQLRNRSSHGRDGDPVATQTDDGANTQGGLPDQFHIDNANMATPPDGHRPQMQMYLQHQPFTAYPGEDPFSPTNVGDEADTVYHEYTHGLSGRLNVDVQGGSTLHSQQSGAMGEAWSDWYAMDYLVDRGLQRDRPAKADVRLFRYDGEGVRLDRTEPIDCKVGQHARVCRGGSTGHRGGYTYADYARVAGGAEVHGDGEIWAQTLWSLRRALGSKRTESLVTRAMELAPYSPSFLDMRNALLVADEARNGGDDSATIWKVFASRGMGFTAGTLGGNDTAPGPSTSLPPAQVVPQTVDGTVTDGDSGVPVANATVTLAFQGAGLVNPTTTTDANGHFTLTGIPEGTYDKLQVVGAGYRARQPVTVGPGGTTLNLTPRYDWAWRANGATVIASTGADYTSFGCGPDGAIDGDLSSGWSSNIGAGGDDRPTGTFHSKHIDVALDQPVDVTDFAVDPSAVCGDDPTASTKGITILTSPDGTTWTPAYTGSLTSSDNGRLNVLHPTAATTGVEFVRIQILSNQTPSFATTCPGGGVAGCRFADLTEVAVYGTAP